MIRFTWSLILMGTDFSPVVLKNIEHANLEIKDSNEKGDIGSKGLYKNISQPYGSCVLTSTMGDFKCFLLEAVKIINQYESLGSSIDDKLLTLNVFYTGQCNFELEIEVIKLLDDNNLNLGISCYADS